MFLYHRDEIIRQRVTNFKWELLKAYIQGPHGVNVTGYRLLYPIVLTENHFPHASSQNFLYKSNLLRLEFHMKTVSSWRHLETKFYSDFLTYRGVPTHIIGNFRNLEINIKSQKFRSQGKRVTLLRSDNLRFPNSDSMQTRLQW